MLSNHIQTAVVLMLALNIPCFGADKPAQGQANSRASETKSQGASGDTSNKERKMQSKLQSSYEAGKIDADALAGYQQRLDELRANEEDLRTRGGMTTQATKDLTDKLDEMDREFDKDVQERAKKPKDNSEQ